MDEDFSAIRRIQAGQENGLVELMERYRQPVFRLAFRYSLSEADAADLTQAAFVKVWERAHQFRPKGSVKSWIFTIAANLCRDRLRRKKHRGRFETEASEDAEFADAKAAAPDTAALSREAVAAIERAVAGLPEKLRFPFVFCVLEDHPYDACAEIIGGSRKTVETRIYRARKQLQAALSDYR